MAQCAICDNEAPTIAKELSVCGPCLKERPDEALPLAMKAHERSRSAFGLPPEPPKAADGAQCRLCVNECRIPEGGTGYCGLRENRGGKLTGVTAMQGKLSWYHDPLPTNCVGDWVCPGGTGAGYPKFAYREGPEHGYTNLAVFFQACSFDCLYCQNWHFRYETLKVKRRSVQKFTGAVDQRTACICYFGGDPTPQLPFSLRTSRAARSQAGERILRICWETNGSMNPGLLDSALAIALESGGCIKFDLKAWDDNIHRALTGITNRRTLENFTRAASKVPERPSPPPLIASTLMVPGYVDEEEVRSIARFVTSLDPEIPYSLLAFHPDYLFTDLPTTSRALAEACLHAAREEGVRNLHIGNVHLLV